MKTAVLVLEDGSYFRGVSIGVCREVSGEVVFNTAMCGYQEVITDPSYAQQIITFTSAHIGNTGISDEDDESRGVHLSGVVMKNIPGNGYGWRRSCSLAEYFMAKDVVAIAGVDTRKLSSLLREKGALRGSILMDDDIERGLEMSLGFSQLQGRDLVSSVTTQSIYEWHEGECFKGNRGSEAKPEHWHVVVYDFGVKHMILRKLVQLGCRVTVVPADTSALKVLEMNPNGILLSNGPGDPASCSYGIETVRQLLAVDIPMFGICFGCQLLALAYGIKTTKMRFGHHGVNHPVQDISTGKVMVTSQNHGFVVCDDSLPNTIKATHRSLFDGTLQGFELVGKQVFGFQGHPESSPGPHDCSDLFSRFVRFFG